MYWTLGGPDDENLKVVGPSDGGLADPGQAIAISLMQVTVALLTLRPTLERLAILQGLRDIEHSAVGELMRSHELETRRRASGTRQWRLRDALLRRRPR
jgi:hypothetical protein